MKKLDKSTSERNIVYLTSYFTFVYIPKCEVSLSFSEFLISVPATSKTIIIVTTTVRTTAMLTPNVTALFLLSLHEKELSS